ncbi:MAG: hypothetical protein FJZ89_00485 [Chloroflexi bacterium]|nr:hypothetical protein [Chloroflexota bacterium]
MTTLTWLHLSDFHIKGTEGPSAAADFADLLSNIKKARQEHGLTPDVVFFTGDVAFSGKSEEYEKAINYFDNLLEACGLKDKRDKLYLVPGNHDVDRKQAPNITFVPQLESLLAHETSYDVIEEFLQNVSNNVAGARDLVFSKFANFAGFMDNLFAGTGVTYERNKLHYVRPIFKDGHVVVVMGLNSAWASFDPTRKPPAPFADLEQGRLLLGASQVAAAIEEAQSGWPNACLRIVLMHHPLYWLAEKDIHNIRGRFYKECHLMLRGHLHCPGFFEQRTPDSRLVEYAAGASLHSRYRSYNLGQLDLDTGKGIVIVQTQNLDESPNWGPDVRTYPNTSPDAMAGQSELDIQIKKTNPF